MNVALILPTYNERENVETLIPAIFSVLPYARVFVVDDSSPDKTADSVRSFQNLYPNLSLLSRPRKEGLGKAYCDAFRMICQVPEIDTVVIMDADFSHDPKDIPRLLQKSDGREVVIGSRYVNGGETSGWETWRRTLSWFGNLYARAVTQLPVFDLTAGFIVIPKNFLQKIDFKSVSTSGYAFSIELKYLLFKHGARLVEQPIVFRNRRGGESKISSHIISEGIVVPWRIRFKKGE